MDESPAPDAPIALAHGPEGAGNATRILGVAEELRAAGAHVEIAGGGAAARFVEMNGFEEYKPPGLDYIDDRQGPDASLFKALLHAAPRVVRRAWEFRRWLADIDPVVLLTDDPLAALPAMSLGIPWYRVDHSSVACYSDTFTRAAFRAFNGVSLRFSRGFFYTSVFENPYPTKANLIPVGPIAHEPDDVEPVDPFDVLLVPSTYAEGFEAIALWLRSDGYSVRLVGGPDWEPVPVMLPYHAAADVVITSGFSSTSEALVAGTPVLNYPFIDCQRGLAAMIEARDVVGIDIVRSVDEAVEGVENPPASPEFENGAPAVASRLLDHLPTEGRGSPDFHD